MKKILTPVLAAIQTIVPPVLLCCSGFLLCIVWFTLMADTRAVGSPQIIPEDILSSIRTFYIVIFGPMTWLVKIVFLTALLSMTLQLTIKAIPWYLRFPIFITNVPPIFMAFLVVIPRLDRFILNTDTPAIQSQLLHEAYTGHLISLSCVSLLIVLQLITVITLQKKAEKKQG